MTVTVRMQDALGRVAPRGISRFQLGTRIRLADERSSGHRR